MSTRSRRFWLIVLVLLTVQVGGGPIRVPDAKAQAGIQVYVNDFTGSGSARLRRTLTRQFQIALMRANTTIKSFTRKDLQDLLQREQYKEVLNCSDSSCVREIVENYGIALSAFGVVENMGGGSCEVAVKMFDRGEPRMPVTKIVMCDRIKLVEAVRGLAEEASLNLAGHADRNDRGAQEVGNTVVLGEGEPDWKPAEENEIWVKFQSEPPGAEIEISGYGVVCAATPCEKDIKPGMHRLTVSLEGYVRHQSLLKVETNMEPVLVKLAGRYGALQVTAQDEQGNAIRADVFIDGANAGESGRSIRVLVGNHEVKVSSQDKGEWTGKVNIRERQTEQLRVKMARVMEAEDMERKGGIQWIRIPGGTFSMGCAPTDSNCANREKPRHQVAVPSFWMMKTEVTVRMYQRCVDSGKCNRYHLNGFEWKSHSYEASNICNWGVGGRENHPINCVAWDQAKSFCEFAGGRLPSEAEWEYAARGTDDRIFPWGNQPATCRYAIMCDNRDRSGCGRGSTWPVCSRPAGVSPFGLCDMAGNVWEWVEDCRNLSYLHAPTDGSVWKSGDCNRRVVRSSRWDDNSASWLRASNRTFGYTSDRLTEKGFRCAKN